MKNNKTITKSQYYTLIGLRESAKINWAILNNLEKSCIEITGEIAEYCGGHSSDYIHGSRDLDEMLKILNIKVE